MLFKGQLEQAQLENRTSDPSNLPNGLLWLNTVGNVAKAYIQGAVRVFVTTDQTQTLTNKTLTAPAINSPTGLVKADVGLSAADNTSDATKNSAVVALTNKTIDADQNTITNIENADIKSGANIAHAKMAALTGSRVMATDGAGVASASSVTTTTLGFLDATSSVQTQLNARVERATLTTKGDTFAATGASTVVRLPVGTNNQVLIADSAQAAGLRWADPAANPTTTKGDLSGFSTVAARVPVGSDGQVLLANSGNSLGVEWSSFLPPSVQRFLSSSGTYSHNYVFRISSGSATIGATYTNNSVTFTVHQTVSAGTTLIARGAGAPLASGTLTRTTGSGDTTITFSQVRAPVYLRVRMAGGGGGGAGSGTASAGAGGTGGTTNFGTSLLSADGGVGGAVGATGAPGPGGVGGAATVLTPGIPLLAISGGQGQNGQNNASESSAILVGGSGAPGCFGGGTRSSGNGATNSGAGGGGGGGNNTTNQFTGGGGGAGAYGEVLLLSPLNTTYSFQVGAAGTAGASGTSGSPGGAGGSGFIEVIEFFQ